MLVATKLCKEYQRNGARTEVLRDITFDVKRAEFVSIVGASGCGKTTLLRLLSGLTDASSGSVVIDNQSRTHPGRDIAFVFQHDGLLPWRTVLRNTILGLELHGEPQAIAKETARKYLDLVGLGNVADSYPHQLSGGMRQRVNLARALTVGADVLLMDEPFAALDLLTRETMQVELMSICAKTRKTVVLVTHHLDEAVFLSDRVFALAARPGRLKAEVAIDLPRPRDLAIKRSIAFQEYIEQLTRLIEN
jgi:NitT/TauT family transport system ATP-binding protein